MTLPYQHQSISSTTWDHSLSGDPTHQELFPTVWDSPWSSHLTEGLCQNSHYRYLFISCHVYVCIAFIWKSAPSNGNSRLSICPRFYMTCLPGTFHMYCMPLWHDWCLHPWAHCTSFNSMTPGSWGCDFECVTHIQWFINGKVNTAPDNYLGQHWLR